MRLRPLNNLGLTALVGVVLLVVVLAVIFAASPGLRSNGQHAVFDDGVDGVVVTIGQSVSIRVLPTVSLWRSAPGTPRRVTRLHDCTQCSSSAAVSSVIRPLRI